MDKTSWTLASHLVDLEKEIAEIFDDDISQKEVIQPTVVVAEEPVISNNPNQWNPFWVQDSDHEDCQLCRLPFSFFNRRHHCRRCGRLLCSNCSPKRIEGFRVCVKCSLAHERACKR
eukprot:TRINITY_DN8657_c0_g1_i2.p1 TRINITY_DN8657_c0_g1~~TRINITY_DN8657_c0_g1_i2.p1  ORF type:complete len:117 (-),score=8.22 TRINITY_DN8657_c0_g1_i2:104-454(-)